VKHTILCGALVLATGGGVAFVVANRPTAPAEPVTARPADAPAETNTNTACTACQSGGSAVVDVTDLSARFAAQSQAKGEFVSFDEPPLARPKGEVQPVEHEVPTPDAREVLPPPREAR
jgi:hypothetical protein